MADCNNPMNEILKSGEPCVGTWRLQSDDPCAVNDTLLANQYIAETLEISGAPLNVFKLLGVHEQGKLIDLTGTGFPLSSGSTSDSSVSFAFDSFASLWKSNSTGANVPGNAYIGYDFGTKKTSFGGEKYKPGAPVLNRISSIKIQQGDATESRATQIRIDRSDGTITYSLDGYTGSGDGSISDISVGIEAFPGKILVSAISPTQFQVISSRFGLIGLATVGQPFTSTTVNFTLSAGTIPFAINDAFTISMVLKWFRVDIVNLPDDNNFNLVSFKNSVPSRYWRIVPLMFNGVSANTSWEIEKLGFLDYEATSIDNIQDIFFLENRDRAYSDSSIVLRCQYTPFDPIGDMGKFGFNILDQYVFSVSFSQMIEKLGRPIIIGDVLELCTESAYDQNMNLVKKYLEVMDAGWSSEGYTPGWTPLIYRFVAQQLIPGTEHRDIIGTVNSQKYGVDDSEFFQNISNIVTSTLTSSENIEQEASNAVPEVGADPQEIASGTSMYDARKGSSDARDLYIEDGLPPDGESYEEGFSLPNMDSTQDGQYFRLNYAPELNVPSRLYKFSLYKRKWIYIETDRRSEYSSHKPSAKRILTSKTSKSIKSDL